MNLDKIKSLDKDDLLNLLGLETRQSMGESLLTGFALFGVGVLVGTGVGLLVAPRPGRELRQDLNKRLHDAPEAMAQLPRRANEAIHHASERIVERFEDGKKA